MTSTINDTWVNGTLINEGDKCVHAKIDTVDTYQLQWAGHFFGLVIYSKTRVSCFTKKNAGFLGENKKMGIRLRRPDLTQPHFFIFTQKTGIILVRSV